MVEAPAPADLLGQSKLLAAMLIYPVLGSHDMSWPTLACAIAPVMGVGHCRDYTMEKVCDLYKSACSVMQVISVAQNRLGFVDEWRAVELDAERVRAKGQFLRLGDIVPVKKPKSLREVMTDSLKMARSYQPVSLSGGGFAGQGD